MKVLEELTKKMEEYLKDVESVEHQIEQCSEAARILSTAADNLSGLIASRSDADKSIVLTNIHPYTIACTLAGIAGFAGGLS